jgi:putative hydrolases of HD superfamily
VPRSGYGFLGAGKQSVAEHSHRMALVAYILAKESKEPVDMAKLLLMCLLHDLPEARTGDLNYVNKLYVEANEDKIIEELAQVNHIGKEMADSIKEYNQDACMEAKIAHEADQLEMLLKLKELHDLGSPKAMEWYAIVANRLKTKMGKEFAEQILNTSTDQWWRQLNIE